MYVDPAATHYQNMTQSGPVTDKGTDSLTDYMALRRLKIEGLASLLKISFIK